MVLGNLTSDEVPAHRPSLVLPVGAVQSRRHCAGDGSAAARSGAFPRRGTSGARPRASRGDTDTPARSPSPAPVPSAEPASPGADSPLQAMRTANTCCALSPAASTRAPSTSSGSATPRLVRVCRYCLESDEVSDFECSPSDAGKSDGFVNPCPCRGSSKYVHLECIVQCFLAQGDWHNFRCPTCKQTYEGRALRELAEISRGRMELQHGKRAPQVAHSLCYFAQAHAQLGNVQQSKNLFEQGLDISEAHFGRGHAATAPMLAELASACGKLGDVKKQRELLERSLKIKEEHFGAGHINTAVTLNNLATVHSELGNVQLEKVLLERSLEIKERHFGKGHVQTAPGLVNLAGVYSELGDVAKGLQLLQLSLEIEERHFGVGHVETAITLNNLALACGESGDMSRMRELLLQSLKIKEQYFGLEHQELCLTLANLSIACTALGQLVQSKVFCERALSICCEPQAPASRRQGIVLLRAASVQMALGQSRTAVDLIGKAASTLRGALGLAASHRVLALECARMSRIWAVAQRDDVVRKLLLLKRHFAEVTDFDSEGACIAIS